MAVKLSGFPHGTISQLFYENVVMGHRGCFEFGKRNLPGEFLKNKDVIDIGASMDGGSMRPYVENHDPNSYVGVDIQHGPGVDVICDAMDLLNKFGEESFDVLVANELLEHLRYWRDFIHIAKNLIRPNGILILTTRSRGFPFHFAPFDFWRYEIKDMQDIFRDHEIISLENDTRKVKGKVTPGVFVAVRKPEDFQEINLSHIKLYSIICNASIEGVSNLDIIKFELLQLGLPYFWKHNGIPFLVREFLSRRYRK